MKPAGHKHLSCWLYPTTHVPPFMQGCNEHGSKTAFKHCVPDGQLVGTSFPEKPFLTFKNIT